MKRIAILLVLSGTLVAGCGSSSGSILWGCDKRTASNACIDYVGSSFASLQTQCTNDSGTVVTSCTRTGILGTCTLAAGTAAEQRQNYYASTSAQTSCQALGNTWTTP